MRRCTWNLTLCLLASAGCAEGDSPTAEAQAALAEEAVAEAQTQGEVAAFALTLSADLSGTEGAWTPEDCVTITERRTVTTYTFADCTGSHGRVLVSGDVTVEVGAGLDGTLTYTVTSYGLTLNAAEVGLASTITYTVADESLTIETAVEGAAVRYTGAASVRTSGEDCRVVDGTWQLSRADQALWLEVAGLTHCGADTCVPTEGSLRVHRGDPAEAVTLTFTGEDTLTWSGTSGVHSGEVTVPCDKP